LNDGSLPGCFALQKPMAPNRCETCAYAIECRKYIAKDRLKPLIAKILEVEAILRGEPV
jgi:hypothetical protein